MSYLHSIALSAIRLPLVAVAFLAVATQSSAQDIDFQVNNLVSLEQVITMQDRLQAETLSPTFERRIDRFEGSSSVIIQDGTRNLGETYISSSSGAVAGIAQIGVSNSATGVIIDSPGSSVAQFQAGRDNSSLVGVIGGANSHVSTLQIGNNLDVAVGLVDSTDTQVVYGQIGSDYNGGIVIRNAPPGTIIRLN
jgi:hypothetical protein